MNYTVYLLKYAKSLGDEISFRIPPNTTQGLWKFKIAFKIEGVFFILTNLYTPYTIFPMKKTIYILLFLAVMIGIGCSPKKSAFVIVNKTSYTYDDITTYASFFNYDDNIREVKFVEYALLKEASANITPKQTDSDNLYFRSITNIVIRYYININNRCAVIQIKNITTINSSWIGIIKIRSSGVGV